MDTVIISKLNDITTAIYILIVIVSLGVVATCIRTWVSLRNLMSAKSDDVFKQMASEYFEAGQINELLNYCEDHLKIKPNHTYALWYLGKAYYQQQNYNEARKCFETLAITEPSWNESHIQPYLTKMATLQKMDC